VPGCQLFLYAATGLGKELKAAFKLNWNYL